MKVDEATYQVLIDTTNIADWSHKNVELEIDRRNIDQNNENVESADHDDESLCVCLVLNDASTLVGH